jgi:hypothetical protein
VVLFDLTNPDSIDEDHPSRAPAGTFPGLVLIGERDGESLRERFANDDDACAWALSELRRRSGAIGEVVIADWIGTICNSNGKRMLRALGAEGSGRLLAIEAPSVSSDQVVRWMTRWEAELSDPSVDLVILRARTDQIPVATPSDPATTVPPVLLAAGYCPTTLQEADETAVAARVSGADVLAGRLWKEAGVTDVGHGIAAFAAKRVTRTWPPPGEEGPAGVWDLQPTGQTGVLVTFTNDFCGIDTSPGDVPDAIRIVLDTDTFESEGYWEHIANLDLSGGTVFVGGWESFETADPWVVQAGRYAVERWQGTSEAVRVRRQA